MASMAFGNDSRNLLRLVEAARTTTAKRELTLRGPAGSRGVPVYVAASPLPADQGGRTCIIVTDLTAQKRTRELEEAQEALARKAGELTRSNADLSNFAHVAAHDLKEPLRGIRHIVGFLLEDYGHTLGTDGRGRLASLDRLTGRMHALLDSLLEYSRVGQEQLIAQPTDLNQVLGDVLAALGPWLRERDAIPAAGPLPTVSCDPVLVGRLFQNLITNGVKYNDSSPRRVEIGALSHTAIPVLYVRDNGIGIPPEHHQTVFRMFKRLSRDERHGGGTGAGLAIAKKIVEHHSGRIWVESLPGEGSTFYFTLGPPPLSPWSAEAAIKDSAAPPIGQAAPDAAMPEGSAARESAGPPA
jgi:signal transduction histidine kinase